MQLEQQFTIPTDIERAWTLLNDVEGIAPCFPGAKVISATEESVDGQVKVKLGPVMLTYGGVLKFLERDEVNHRLVMDGHGVDAKGNGSASAQVTAQLSDAGDGTTRCAMVTDLNITGRPAQFGRGMMLEIGNNILGKFSNNLAAMLSEEAQAAPPAAATGVDSDSPVADVSVSSPIQSVAPRISAPGARKMAPMQREESLDLLSAAGGATAKRLLPAMAGAAAVVAIVIWIIVK
jgi:carbon monoxide dehydrogenase subunit G